MKDLSKHYGTLNAHERLLLSLEATARQDWQEAETLAETCPKFQYLPQRDLAFTGKHETLMTLALLHAALFYKARGAMVAAWALGYIDPEARTAYPLRRMELKAQVTAWERFCNHAGLDPVIVMQAFGFELDPLLDDFPETGIDPTKEMIDEIVQVHLKSWT